MSNGQKGAKEAERETLIDSSSAARLELHREPEKDGAKYDDIIITVMAALALVQTKNSHDRKSKKKKNTERTRQCPAV